MSDEKKNPNRAFRDRERVIGVERLKESTDS